MPGAGHIGGVSCQVVSRHCLLAGAQCRLPSEVNGSSCHRNHHIAHATAELCRPYPLGFSASGPPYPPHLDGQSLKSTTRKLCSFFWTTARLRDHSDPMRSPVRAGSLLSRLREIFQLDYSRVKVADPLHFKDLLAAYYFRRLQAEVVVHE